MKAAGILLIAAWFAGAVVTPAHSGPIVDWDPAFFYEPGATPYNSIAGSEMKIVGTVSKFDGPLAFLNPTMGTTEYTFFVHNLISTGTAPFPPFYITVYNGGNIEIYADNAKNATFAPLPSPLVPATFIDGTLILSGTMNNFNTQTNTITPHNTGVAEGNISWTGGSLYDLVSQCPALFTGGLTWFPDVMIPGYLFRHDGKIDHECPTPTQQGTWGRIKSIYR